MYNKRQQKLNNKILKAANRKKNTSNVTETTTSKQNKGIEQNLYRKIRGQQPQMFKA